MDTDLKTEELATPLDILEADASAAGSDVPEDTDDLEDADGVPAPGDDEEDGEPDAKRELTLAEALERAENGGNRFDILDSALAENEEAREALDEFKQEFTKGYEGFEKLHAQKREVCELAGVESLADVTEIVEEHLATQEVYAGLRSSRTRDASVKKILGHVCKLSGYDPMDIVAVMEGEERLSADDDLQIHDAMRLLGVTEADLKTLDRTKVRTKWENDHLPAWQKVKALYPALDLDKAFEIQSKNPNLTRAEVAKLLELSQTKPAKPAPIAVRKTTGVQGTKQDVLRGRDAILEFAMGTKRR